jgi:uncharacterized alpha-E superfamily protein
MMSRVAEHCFWLSRYLERVEHTARLLDVNHALLLDLDVPVEHQWRPLLIINGIHDWPGDPESEAVQRSLTWEPSNAVSIVSSLSSARENARIIREVISAEMWERLNYYYLWLQSPAARALYDRNRSEFYGQIKRINQLFHGITDGTMSHGEPWEFLQLGKYLERACQTARIVDVKYHVLLPSPSHVGTPIDHAHWVAILTSCSGYEPFHKLRGAREQGMSAAVPGFLITDPLFPRSVRRCLVESQRAAHAISGRPVSQPGNAVERDLADLLGWLAKNGIIGLIKAGLHESLTTVVNRIHDIGDAIHSTYFDVRLQSAAVTDRSSQQQTQTVETASRITKKAHANGLLTK